MKKGLLVFLRVTFVIGAMLIASFFGFNFYFDAQSNRAIEKSLIVANSPIIGDKKAPFTLVEFFDYRCPHCSVMSKIVDEAVNNDPDIKILLRPVVVSDEESMKIATLVLGAEAQKRGSTLLLHKEIMALPSIPNYETVEAMAEAKGINVQQAEIDGQSFRPVITENTSLIVDIGFYGVPALIIGDKGFISQGPMPGINELRLMILDAKQRLNIK
jgi:protein-disulfide isomerase